MLLVEIKPRAARLDLAAHRGRDAEPFAVVLGEILGDRTDRAGLGRERLDHLVERLEHGAMHLDLPGAVRHDVVTGARLRFRARGQDVLVALRGDVVDRHLNLVGLAPLVAQLGQRVVGAGHPMVPDAQRELAGGIGVTNIRSGYGGGGRERRGREQLAPRNARA